MKMKLFLTFGLLMATAVCRAQMLTVTNSGWLTVASMDVLAVTNDFTDEYPVEMEDAGPKDANGSASIAEVITPDIQALADGLEHDPVRIFNYVHDHIRYVVYFGSKKGAALTLLEKSGNDFDQCALLVALLRAAGYTNNTGYQFGWMRLPYEDGNHRDLRHWLGLSLTNSDWGNTTNYLNSLFASGSVIGGYPMSAAEWGNNLYAFQRVWVTLVIGGITNYLDPAFKVSEPIAGLNLPLALGFTNSTDLSNALMTAAQGLDMGTYVTNVLEGPVRNVLSNSTASLLNYLQNNCPNASVEEVLSGQYIVPSTNTTLSQGLLFPTTNLHGTMPVVNWVNQPTNMMSTLKITFLNINYQWFMPQLKGQRLSLVVTAGGSAQLWKEDTNVASASTASVSGPTFNLTMIAYHPGIKSGWNTNSNVFIPGERTWPSPATAYQKTNATYAIVYAFEPDWGWLQQRQRQLDTYRQAGDDTSRQVLSETLNVMGLNWQLQVGSLGRMLAAQIGVLPHCYHRIGRMSQESGWGYYVDVYLALDGSSSSATPGWGDHVSRWFDLLAYFGSAMEHGLIEQLQATNLVGASTIKILQLANTNHQAVYLASSTNWSAVQTKLVHYSSAATTGISTDIAKGAYVLLPRDGSTSIDGAGSWTGYGFVDRIKDLQIGMLIGDSQHHGGFVSDPYATVNSPFVAQSAYSQPLYFSPATAFVRNITGADPVNMADGTFQVETTDLSLSQTEPRGLSLARYYSSSRRNSNLAGMAPGWLHNYYLKAASVSAVEAGLGGTTPAQMAPMLVATAAAIALYQGDPPDPRNWLLTALIAKWGIDQLTGNAVSVSLGKDTLQFIRHPDGSYTPPANCTMALLKTNSAYWLQERHGRTFQFNTAGWATNIVDQYNQSLKLAYNASHWVTNATDWQDRWLRFTYGASPARLTSVSDSAGRSVSYGYAGTNLTSVTDPEGKTTTFRYDTSHQITATSNALGQLVVSNVYNGFGRVTTQYTQGDPNKMWKVSWSGWQTVEQDPAGGQRVFFYDDKSRLIAQQDALGHTSQSVYDGQDRVVMTISPLNETNQFVYDGNHNLLATIDPLGFSNQYVYDSQNRLVGSVDARGNPSSFGYNAQFSLTGVTNGAGDWVAFDYNTDGTLAARAEPGGTTSFSYDDYGQLSSITYPGGLGSESFGNNSLGDVTSHANARQFATTFQYNSRRQLTNTIATNSTASLSYDAVGNLQSSKDPRSFSTVNTWSPTRKLLTTTLPATPQGTPAVTNIYDARDWLARCVDPLQKATLFTNDLAGRLISVTDPLLRTTRFGYDPDGHKKAATNAAQEVTLQQWNARGEMTKLTDPATQTVLSGYDPAGNQTTLTNRRSKGWQFQFDGANRLTNTITPMLRQTKQVWNNRGLLQSLTDPNTNTTTLSYDARARLTNRTDQVGTTACQYDGNGNLTKLTETINSQPSTLNYSYDAYDRVSAFTNAEGCVIQYRYDANGNLTNLVYPGPRNVYYLYDSLNRLTNVTDWATRKTTITYDLASRVTSITRPNGTVRLINYDAGGETTNIVEKTLGNFPIAFFTLGWNNSGRVAWEFAGPLPHTNTSPPSRTMTFDDDNRLATFKGPTMGSSQNVGVDPDGNMTSGPLTNDTFVSYAYNARNQLTNAGALAYAYDPAGNRTSVTNGTNVVRFVVNPNAALPQTLIRTQPDDSQTLYVYGFGLLYEVNLSPGGSELNTRTYHYDYRGSTVAITDGSGMPTDRVEYSPYGMTTCRAGATDTPFLYNGRYGVMTDPNGLLYMRARYYNPYLCRFINPDPAGFGGGLNWYCYADGDPIRMADPFGLGAVGEGARLPSWLAGPASSYDLSAFSPDAQAAVQESFRRSASLAMQGLDFDPSIPQVPERSTATYLLTFGGLFLGGLASVEATAAAGTIPRVNVLPSSGNRFIVSPGGDAIIVPRGASGPVPVINQGGRTTGFGYTGGSGGLGLDPRVSNVRIMDATLPRGPSPGYPAGYVNYRNNALPTPQSVNPFTGQTLAPNDPFWHIPLTPP